MTTSTSPDDGAAAAATRLQLMWLASPALPVGGYAYSEALEAAVAAGLVVDEATAGDWLVAQLQLSPARSEWPVVAQACAAWAEGDTARAAALNDWLLRTRETAELRAQSEQMGRSLLDWLRNGAHAADARIAALAAMQPGWPTAFGLAAALAGATPTDAALACAWSWCENAVQAAMKAVPLGQAAAQRILGRLAAPLPALAAEAAAMPDERRQAHAPMLAILSARHEAQYSRLFRS